MGLERTIIEILTSAIAPVTLITGVSLLTSIMGARFGRCIDRMRMLLKKFENASLSELQKENHLLQIEILYRRTKMLRNSLISAGICILFVVLTVTSQQIGDTLVSDKRCHFSRLGFYG